MKAEVKDVGPVVIKVYRSRRTADQPEGDRRPQPWRWRAVSAGNHKKLGAGEAYHNGEDCVKTVRLLFTGTGHTLRRARHEDEIL